MLSVESEAQSVRRQLQRVLDSAVFARTERLSRFRNLDKNPAALV